MWRFQLDRSAAVHAVLPADLKRWVSVSAKTVPSAARAERRQFAENLTGGSLSYVVVENARSLEGNVGRGAGLRATGRGYAVAARCRAPRARGIRPQLRERSEEPFLCPAAAQHVARQARRQHYPHGARKNEDAELP